MEAVRNLLNFLLTATARRLQPNALTQELKTTFIEMLDFYPALPLVLFLGKWDTIQTR